MLWRSESSSLRGEMAQKGVNREIVSCSMCLNLLKDPVAIPCGHSYCMNCIKNHWDGEEEKKIYSCPQCRKTFTPRPVLVKNTMLADLVEELKKTGLQDAPVDHCYAGPEDVACDVCTGRKLKALKSCLRCTASYCENHLQPHYDAPPLKKHKLVEPSNQLQENICPHHDEVMKMFCCTDQQCICYLCSVDEHKGHDTVSAAAERTERQRELEGRRQNIQQRIQDREEDVKVLQQEVENINRSADKAVEDSEKMLTELIHLMEKRRSDVKQKVRSQQQTEVSRVLELQEKLEQEITELKRKDAELKKLSHTEDHTHFLHNYPSVSALSEDTYSSSINIRPLRHFEDVTAAVTEARDKLQDLLTQTWTNISWTVTQVDVLLPRPQPKIRAEFLKYSREITLDPNTADTQLLLSDGNRKVTNMDEDLSYSDHPDRFTDCLQVLSRESLTGRCYWEVEWGGEEEVDVAVAYKNISREGWPEECRFGLNDKSWSLSCSTDSYDSSDDSDSDQDKHYYFWFNKIQTPVSGPSSSRVGVYLDHSAGILSFYRVSETMTLLHRVQTTFTQPLHAGLYVNGCGDSARFIELKQSEVVSGSAMRVNALLSEPEPEPDTRAEFLKYSREITVDPNTAYTWLLLSDGNRKVTNMFEDQSYSDHPDRFTGCLQVLSRESLTGCCYWEVELRGWAVGVAVTYKNISRVGRSDECRFGFNDKSWSLVCDTGSYYFSYNKIKTPISCPRSSRFGVYLDHSAGILSFYSVSETMTLLHRVQTRFTQPLHAGLLVGFQSTAEFLELKQSEVVLGSAMRVNALLSEPEPEPEPKIRAEFLKYSREITLDPNTANTWLLLIEGNRKVTYMFADQSYSDHPDRFTGCFQVLSRESLTGRCYWEVEMGGEEVVGVAVAYKNISRAGDSDECRFGYNDKSWSLNCSTDSYDSSDDSDSDQDKHYNFWFNKIQTPVSGPLSSRVGVYLDHSAGILSFYRVSETMTLLHRVQTTFTQPLHAGLCIYGCGDTARFIELKQSEVVLGSVG